METRAVSSIEIALRDILSKSLNTPVWRLLGGKTYDYLATIPIWGRTISRRCVKPTRCYRLSPRWWSATSISMVARPRSRRAAPISTFCRNTALCLRQRLYPEDTERHAAQEAGAAIGAARILVNNVRTKLVAVDDDIFHEDGTKVPVLGLESYNIGQAVGAELASQFEASDWFIESVMLVSVEDRKADTWMQRSKGAQDAFLATLSDISTDQAVHVTYDNTMVNANDVMTTTLTANPQVEHWVSPPGTGAVIVGGNTRHFAETCWPSSGWKTSCAPNRNAAGWARNNAR